MIGRGNNIASSASEFDAMRTFLGADYCVRFYATGLFRMTRMATINPRPIMVVVAGSGTFTMPGGPSLKPMIGSSY